MPGEIFRVGFALHRSTGPPPRIYLYTNCRYHALWVLPTNTITRFFLELNPKKSASSRSRMLGNHNHAHNSHPLLGGRCSLD